MTKKLKDIHVSIISIDANKGIRDCTVVLEHCFLVGAQLFTVLV